MARIGQTLEKETVKQIKQDIKLKLKTKEITEKYNITYTTFYYIKNGYSHNDIKRRKTNQYDEAPKEEKGRKLLILAQKYWQTFSKDDFVQLYILPEGKFKAKNITGQIKHISKSYMQVFKNHKNIQVHFADVVTKRIKIRKCKNLEVKTI